MNDKKDGDDLDTLSAEEYAWLEWFYSLSQEDQNLIELCGDKGMSATPANFDKMKELVKDLD